MCTGRGVSNSDRPPARFRVWFGPGGDLSTAAAEPGQSSRSHPQDRAGDRVSVWWLAGALVVLVVVAAVGSRRARRAVIRGIRRREQAAAKVRARDRRAAAARQRPAPLTGRAQPVRRAPVVRTARCSAACRTSRKPAYDKAGRLRCDCPCGGRDHGRYRPNTAAAVRATTAPRRGRGRGAT